MNHKLIFTPTVEVTFTEREVDVLIKCSRGHYDPACKALSSDTSRYGTCSKCGNGGGLLLLLKSLFFDPEGPETVTWSIDTRALQLMCKVTEQLMMQKDPEVTAIHEGLLAVITHINEEYPKHNPSER